MPSTQVHRNDARRLEKISAALSANRAALARARERVIEALGERMCGSGDGPTPQALEALADARAQEALARRAMSRVVTALARKFIDRVRGRAPARRH